MFLWQERWLLSWLSFSQSEDALEDIKTESVCVIVGGSWRHERAFVVLEIAGGHDRRHGNCAVVKLKQPDASCMLVLVYFRGFACSGDRLHFYLALEKPAVCPLVRIPEVHKGMYARFAHISKML